MAMIKKPGISFGFTLVEILVVMAITIIVGTIAVNIFFTTLKGAAKTELVKEVKQNGDYALEVMERTIRNARKTSEGSCSGSPSGAISLETESGTAGFACVNNRIEKDNVPLTSNRVKVKDCGFTCYSGGGIRPDVITINFTVTQPQDSGLAEERAGISFQTTVSLRNY